MAGSIPVVGSVPTFLGGYPSGQRGLTVNQLGFALRWFESATAHRIPTPYTTRCRTRTGCGRCMAEAAGPGRYMGQPALRPAIASPALAQAVKPACRGTPF